LFFTEHSFNSKTRKFCGLVNYGGSHRGTISETYEVIFDTHFLCVLSGRSVHNKVDGGKETCATFGVTCIYTNSNLSGKVDVQTVKRLEGEGATKKTTCPFRQYNAIPDKDPNLSVQKTGWSGKSKEWVSVDKPRPSFCCKRNQDAIRYWTTPMKAPSSMCTSTIPPIECVYYRKSNLSTKVDMQTVIPPIKCVYTNSKLSGKVDVQTVKRLEGEGATKKTACPLRQYNAIPDKDPNLSVQKTGWSGKSKEWVSVDKPRPSFCCKRNQDTIRYATAPMKAPSSMCTSTIPPIVYRKSTLR